MSVIRALNVAYRVGEPRPWWKRRFVAIALTVGLSVFMVTALILVVFGGWLGGAIAAVLGLGAVFAVVGWLATSLGLRLYVAHSDSYNATYGSIGGMILLMLWLFLSNVALLVRAEINSVIEEAASAPNGLHAHRRNGKDTRPPA